MDTLRDTVIGIWNWLTTGWFDSSFSGLFLWAIGLVAIVLLTHVGYGVLMWVATRIARRGASFDLQPPIHVAVCLVTLSLVCWLVCGCAVSLERIGNDWLHGSLLTFTLLLVAYLGWGALRRSATMPRLPKLAASAGLIGISVFVVWLSGASGIIWIAQVTMLLAVWATAGWRFAASLGEYKRIRTLRLGVNGKSALGAGQ